MLSADSSSHAAPILGGGGSADPPPHATPEPPKRADPRGDVLAVLAGAGPGKPVSIDTIHAEVNVDTSKPHLAKGPIEQELAALVAAGTVLKTPADNFELPSASEPVEPPMRTRAARAALLVVLLAGMTYSPIEGSTPDEMMHTPDGLTIDEVSVAILRANKTNGPELPSPWVEAFATAPGTDVLKMTTVVGSHIKALIDAKLVRGSEASLPPEKAVASPETETMADKIVAIVGGDKDRLLAAIPGWKDAELELVKTWLAKNPVKSTDDDPEPIRRVLKAPVDDGSGMATVYLLEPGVREDILLHGAEVVAARSIHGWVAPALAEAKTKIDELVNAERAKIEADTKAEIDALRGSLQQAREALVEERKVSHGYDAWFMKHAKVKDPRKAFLTVQPAEEPDGAIEDFEEEVKIDDIELRRIIGEKADLKAALIRMAQEHKSKKDAFGALEEDLKTRIADLEATSERAARGEGATHIVKKKVRHVVENGYVITRSADPHDAGRELRRIEAVTNTQLSFPGTGTKASPAWTPTSTPGATAAVEPQSPPVQPAPPPSAPPVTSAPPDPPPAHAAPKWGGKVELNMAGIRRMLVNDDKAEHLGLFQTSIGATGIYRGDLSDKFGEFIGTPVTDDMLKLINRVIAATLKAGDLIEGTILQAEEGGGTSTRTILWHKSVATPAGAKIEGDEPEAAPAPAPATTESKEASGKKGAKAKDAGKASSGKAAAGTSPAPRFSKSRR